MSKPMTILVVDVDQAFVESVANLLLACGFDDFEIAHSLEEAREAVAKRRFDVMLIDLFVPELTGLAFAEEMRAIMPKTRIMILIEAQHLPEINNAEERRLNFPTVLKSFVSTTLPQLLSEESNSMSQDL